MKTHTSRYPNCVGLSSSVLVDRLKKCRASRTASVVFARRRLKYQLAKKGMIDTDRDIASDVLTPYALTICFARRFATYKRASLLLRDKERLMRLLTDLEHPIQLVFAGKAHPNDPGGKELIKEMGVATLRRRVNAFIASEYVIRSQKKRA